MKSGPSVPGEILTTHSLQLVGAVEAVPVAVALPALADAASVQTGELLWLAPVAHVLDAVPAIVGQVPVALGTLAFSTSWACQGNMAENIRAF